MQVFRIFAFICVALFGPINTWAAASSFPEHNFAIEIPNNWMSISPRPAETVVAVQVPDASKKLIVTANKIPDNERATAGVNFRAGIKDTMKAQGWKFEADQSLESGGLPFVRLSARRASNNHLMVAYTLVKDDQAYLLMFLLNEKGDPKDPETLSILSSFRLLASRKP